jgi:hypothetical protein
MKAKFSVILMWWVMVIALPVSVPSVLLGAQPTVPGLGKLLKLPKPLKPSKTLSFSSPGELKLLLQQLPAYPGTYRYAGGVSAVNADPITKRVWAVSLNDGLDPRDIGDVGFQTTTLRNTGSFSPSGVTVTVTANILKQQQPAVGWDICLMVKIFKDGDQLDDVVKYVHVTQSGSQSLTSAPFTMEPNHDYYATGEIYCESYVAGETASVIAEITDIKWTL